MVSLPCGDGHRAGFGDELSKITRDPLYWKYQPESDDRIWQAFASRNWPMAHGKTWTKLDRNSQWVTVSAAIWVTVSAAKFQPETENLKEACSYKFKFRGTDHREWETWQKPENLIGQKSGNRIWNNWPSVFGIEYPPVWGPGAKNWTAPVKQFDWLRQVSISVARFVLRDWSFLVIIVAWIQELAIFLHWFTLRRIPNHEFGREYTCSCKVPSIKLSLSTGGHTCIRLQGLRYLFLLKIIAY